MPCLGSQARAALWLGSWLPKPPGGADTVPPPMTGQAPNDESAPEPAATARFLQQEGLPPVALVKLSDGLSRALRKMGKEKPPLPASQVSDSALLRPPPGRQQQGDHRVASRQRLHGHGGPREADGHRQRHQGLRISGDRQWRQDSQPRTVRSGRPVASAGRRASGHVRDGFVDARSRPAQEGGGSDRGPAAEPEPHRDEAADCRLREAAGRCQEARRFVGEVRGGSEIRPRDDRFSRQCPHRPARTPARGKGELRAWCTDQVQLLEQKAA